MLLIVSIVVECGSTRVVVLVMAMYFYHLCPLALQADSIINERLPNIVYFTSLLALIAWANTVIIRSL